MGLLPEKLSDQKRIEVSGKFPAPGLSQRFFDPVQSLSSSEDDGFAGHIAFT